jgi:hypothetical protein
MRLLTGGVEVPHRCSTEAEPCPPLAGTSPSPSRHRSPPSRSVVCATPAPCMYISCCGPDSLFRRIGLPENFRRKEGCRSHLWSSQRLQPAHKAHPAVIARFGPCSGSVIHWRRSIRAHGNARTLMRRLNRRKATSPNLTRVTAIGWAGASPDRGTSARPWHPLRVRDSQTSQRSSAIEDAALAAPSDSTGR